ncbi:MAG: Type 1 glutamine amidotransferase-like domain-containing protein [Candidatus Woesearchaeota archaeon]|jgi:dipeptidase E
MGKIIAIGGGEIGRPGKLIETLTIDKEIVSLSNKKNPKLLFIPTASSDSEGYCEVVRKYFGEKLGCSVDVLNLIKENYSKKQIREKILSANIIYVGGGNTLKMMNIWKKKGIDKLLHEAYLKGVVLSGVSAGSICWFNNGNSDSRKFTSNKFKLIKVTGLGLINAMNCPHFDIEKYRKNELKRMMQKTKGIAIALDNLSAIEIIDDKYRILKSQKNAKAYRTFWRNNKYYVEEIKYTKKLNLLKDLLTM